MFLLLGKHDGTVKGREYFRCRPQHGIFVRLECLTRALAPTKICSSTSQSQVSSHLEKGKNSVLQGSPSSKNGAGALFQPGNAAASTFSRKQEIRKSWINWSCHFVLVFALAAHVTVWKHFFQSNCTVLIYWYWTFESWTWCFGFYFNKSYITNIVRATVYRLPRYRQTWLHTKRQSAILYPLRGKTPVNSVKFASE